ncbi:hypothetical protein OIE62_40985 (plasmid) [Streptomyces scopuliridis]|uniref:Uncharacterized protein n=1 Tax=Streptomyces scopuliridis TaxID=452529 RepID=A0ACD4ZZ15_9ACTN|nr:hypothetical protein [Streptomyces scopuliridis]WSB39308.1 hypothetical protein OG949_42005 [Streptomyces scopuliridis]WSC03558.1 hypothetical protein OG835_42510 [Streptomyces scopuliridis]WSC11298.1 hypothetical protein OIE62_40985 [Streptomyces scopuliridis]
MTDHDMHQRAPKRAARILEGLARAERALFIRAQARQRAATSTGLVISCRAFFVFGREGTSDAGRVRDLTVAVAPFHAAAIVGVGCGGGGWASAVSR